MNEILGISYPYPIEDNDYMFHLLHAIEVFGNDTVANRKTQLNQEAMFLTRHPVATKHDL